MQPLMEIPPGEKSVTCEENSSYSVLVHYLVFCFYFLQLSGFLELFKLLTLFL